MNTQAQAGVFNTTGDEMGSGIEALFNSDAEFSNIDLDMIEIKKQVREIFEDEDNLLAEMAETIKEHGVIQPILLRETDTGYELIAGERRVRASKLAGKKSIPALIKKMTDKQAEDAQLIENIHRLNLSQIELAKRVQRDLDALGGDVAALLKKYNKSHSWLSKVLSLLTLSDQAKRLIAENISADVEVIGKVKAVEKIDPEKAKALVDDLKATRGEGNAREKAEKVKKEVKPSKNKQPPSKPKKEEPLLTASVEDVLITEVMKTIHLSITQGKTSKEILAKLKEKNRTSLEHVLKGFYDNGLTPQDAGKSIIYGFNQGIFAHGDYREFQLAAYSYGLNSGEFSLIKILESIK